MPLPAEVPVREVRQSVRRSLAAGGAGHARKRIHALALYLKSNQLFSYERLQGALPDLFGLTLSQGALMNMFLRTAPIFAVRRNQALAALRRVDVEACDETGARIEGCNAYQWVFCSAEAIVHTADFTRAAQAVRDTMDGHQSEVWMSDRYSAEQGHGRLHQTCLAHLDRKARFVAEHGSDLIGMRLQLAVCCRQRKSGANTGLRNPGVSRPRRSFFPSDRHNPLSGQISA